MPYKRHILEQFKPEDIQELIHEKYGDEKANTMIRGEAYNILSKPLPIDQKMLVIKEACIRILTGQENRKELNEILK